jgi:carbohydrate esterase-like sialic acid-specific acetylesterase
MLRLLFLALLWTFTTTGLAAQVRYDRGPQAWQLVPRAADNFGQVEVAGSVTAPGYNRIHLRVTTDGLSWDLQSLDLNYVAGVADFSLTSAIEAGLVEYRFRVYLEGGGGLSKVGDVGNVVCGDAFLIQGQSNAVAGDGHNQGLANSSQRHWLRSFGTGSLNGAETLADRRWYLAEGQIGSSTASVGAWGLRMGQLLVDELQVPIAILNGAIGATPIIWHQRQDTFPENTATNYGRLLFRARAAGLDQHIRALIWYQGEADSNTPVQQYFNRFQSLLQDWRQDFPGLEQVYMFQIHNGCGTPDMGIRELQRQMNDLFNGVSVMSSSNTSGHDGCHYYYNGYRQLGNRIARMIGRDIYGQAALAGINPPNVETAHFTDAARTQIELIYRDAGQILQVDAGAEAYFELNAPESVVQVTVNGNRLLLDLSGPTTATTLAWVGHKFSGPGIYNQLGVGTLTFEFPVLP